MLPPQSGLSSTQVERPYYQLENSSLYSEQNHPIQEVLSVQGNLNFLQESQIELECKNVILVVFIIYLNDFIIAS